MSSFFLKLLFFPDQLIHFFDKSFPKKRCLVTGLWWWWYRTSCAKAVKNVGCKSPFFVCRIFACPSSSFSSFPAPLFVVPSKVTVLFFHVVQAPGFASSTRAACATEHAVEHGLVKSRFILLVFLLAHLRAATVFGFPFNSNTGGVERTEGLHCTIYLKRAWIIVL